MNGNSRSYTKDTDMQFARALSKDSASKSFGSRPSRSEGGRNESRSSAPRSSAPRSDAPRANTGEKFGNPRPRTNSNQTSSDRPARAGGDNAPRRPRSFA